MWSAVVCKDQNGYFKTVTKVYIIHIEESQMADLVECYECGVLNEYLWNIILDHMKWHDDFYLCDACMIKISIILMAAIQLKRR